MDYSATRFLCSSVIERHQQPIAHLVFPHCRGVCKRILLSLPTESPPRLSFRNATPSSWFEITKCLRKIHLWMIYPTFSCNIGTTIFLTKTKRNTTECDVQNFDKYIYIVCLRLQYLENVVFALFTLSYCCLFIYCFINLLFKKENDVNVANLAKEPVDGEKRIWIYMYLMYKYRKELRKTLGISVFKYTDFLRVWRCEVRENGWKKGKNRCHVTVFRVNNNEPVSTVNR